MRLGDDYPRSGAPERSAVAPTTGETENNVTTELDSALSDQGLGVDQVVADVVSQVRRMGVAPPDSAQLRELVETEWARHDGARVRTFLPVLVRRAVLAQILG